MSESIKISSEKILPVSYRSIRKKLIGSGLLKEPFILLFHFLPLLLYKSLDASLWQIVLFISLNPMMSILSFFIARSFKCSRKHFLFLEFFAHLPFFFILLFPYPAYVIFASATYMLFSRASAALWMEALKNNFSKSLREKLFSLSYVLGYLEGMLLCGLGISLDAHQKIWSFFLSGTALLSFLGVIIQGNMPFPSKGNDNKYSFTSTFSWTKRVLQPLKDTFSILRTRNDFAVFQGAFMIGGGGLMLSATTLPVFFVKHLNISYTSFGKARTLAMGAGIIISSMLWTRAMKRFHVNFLAGLIIAFCSLFTVCILLSTAHIFWLYLAYVIYGITQGGSHVIWHLSGPIFSGKENSIPFSSINLITVGIRGAIVPALGGFLNSSFGPVVVLIFGICLFSFGSYWILRQQFHTLSSART